MTPSPNLVNCPDCNHRVSRQAETCPQCGRFFQRFKSEVEIKTPLRIDRSWWSLTVMWGVIFSWIVPLIALVLLFIFFAFLGAGLSSLPVNR